MDAADNLTNEAGVSHGTVPHGQYGAGLPVDDTVSSYYLRLHVDDRPGVVAFITRILADHSIGILSMSQPEVAASATEADLMLMLHKAPFGKMKAALAAHQRAGLRDRAPGAAARGVVAGAEGVKTQNPS